MQIEINRFKNKKFWLISIGFLFSLYIFYSIGAYSTKVKLEDKKVSYDELVKEIEKRKSFIKDFDEQVKQLKADVESHQEEYNKALEVIKEKEEIEREITELAKQIDAKKGEIATLDETLKAKNKELASVEGEIKTKAEQPKILPAGFFTVGKDIPESRYKVVPNGGFGNFFVNGGMKVNIILGKGGFGEPEYIFEAFDGDEIELTTSAKFIPVE